MYFAERVHSPLASVWLINIVRRSARAPWHGKGGLLCFSATVMRCLKAFVVPASMKVLCSALHLCKLPCICKCTWSFKSHERFFSMYFSKMCSAQLNRPSLAHQGRPLGPQNHYDKSH